VVEKLCNTKDLRVIVTAGLGNQLHQLACGMALALRNQRPLCLDSTWYKLQTYHPKRLYQLPMFNISESFPMPVRHVSYSLPAAVIQLVRCQPKLLRLSSLLGGWHVISEVDYHRADQRLYEHLPLGAVFLRGYWQTRDHFLHAASSLKQLQPVFPYSADYRQCLERIQEAPSAFVHVRRGDFANWPESMMSSDFYRAASSKVSDELGATPRWFVFSEEQEWCRANLPFLKNATFVQLDSPHKDIEEIFLMKACGAGIIANSSFSWWGAALGDRPGRPIVASKYRHGKNIGAMQEERLLDHWIQIEEF
jgi:hypothetical protein